MPADLANQTGALLQVEDLSVRFQTDSGLADAVDGVSFTLGKGEILGLAGESGCGKSVTSMAIMRLLPKNAVIGGRAVFGGTDLLGLGEAEMRRVRGGGIGMVFQEPQSALNPVFTVGDQLAEAVRAHTDARGREVKERVIFALREVNIPDPSSRIMDYPHQMSGGMKQRVMIAMALLGRPELLIADEPTTALDVTVQAGILDLLLKLREERGLAVLLITHDLGIVAEVADRAAVMYAGRFAETAGADTLFAHTSHPYSQGLFRSRPSPGSGMSRLRVIPGRVPSALDQPAACRFHPRCPAARDVCSRERPALREIAPGHVVACHFTEAGASSDWAWQETPEASR